MLLVSGKWFNSGTIRQSALAVIGKNRWYSGILAVWDEGLRRGKTPTMLHTHEVTGSSPVVSTSGESPRTIRYGHVSDFSLLLGNEDCSS